MHGPINVKSPNNTSTWQMGFNSAFKGLIYDISILTVGVDNYPADLKFVYYQNTAKF
jgi:hypothetical protein